MHIFTLIKKQTFKNFGALIFVTGFSFILIASLVLICYLSGTSVMIFTRDPASIAGFPYYSGYFSQLGGVFWVVCTTIALFTANIIKNNYKNFLLFSGFFTLVLGVDDLFMIHDGMLGKLKMSENIFYSFYVILSVLYFTLFYKIILNTPFIFLLITFTCFALSVLDDKITISGIHPYLFEDGLKMVGIISWMVYHFLLSKRLLTNRNIPLGGKFSRQSNSKN